MLNSLCLLLFVLSGLLIMLGISLGWRLLLVSLLLAFFSPLINSIFSTLPVVSIANSVWWLFLPILAVIVAWVRFTIKRRKMQEFLIQEERQTSLKRRVEAD